MRVAQRIQRALQNPGGGCPIDDGATTSAAQVGLADQEALDRRRRKPFVP